LQYLETPYALLEKVKAFSFPFILIDRTGFMGGAEDRLTIQRVPPTIYPASYPCWFFSRRKFTSFFEDAYELVEEFDALAGVMHLDGKEVALDKGFILKRRSWP
jgi:putative methyltransferase (TIGR04325 family)